jgi:hypothetical protein
MADVPLQEKGTLCRENLFDLNASLWKAGPGAIVCAGIRDGSLPPGGTLSLPEDETSQPGNLAIKRAISPEFAPT